MLRRIVNVAMVTVLVVTAFASLAAANVSGPYEPMVQNDEFTRIKPGELHWYAFTFDFDEDLETPMQIKLFSEPFHSTELLLLNRQQVEEWIDDGTEGHFGCCTKVYKDREDEVFEEYALWSGMPGATGTHYILVKTAGDVNEPVSYRFEVTGENFAMLGEKMAPVEDVAVETVMATVPEKQPVTVEGLTGSSPFFAMPPTTDWIELKPGAAHWYAFDFDFDPDLAEQAEIRLVADKIDDVLLTVHNGEQARMWELGEDLKHFGCCSFVNQDNDEDGVKDFAMWSGSLRSSGRYYIVVEAPDNVEETIYYSFDLTGDGIQ